MKIIFFIDGLSSGGKERRLVELMKGLKLHPDVDFILVVMSTEIHYSEVYDLQIDIIHLIRKTKKDLSIFKKFYDICKNYNPDIIHTWDGMTSVYAMFISKLLNIVFVNGMITNASLNSNLSKEKVFSKLSFPLSNIIISNSKAGLNAYKAPKNKSIYIHNGFNTERINKNICSEQIKNELGINTEFVIGMVASFSEKKDYATYFSAAQILLKSRKDVIFISIGSKTDSKSAISIVTESKENFRFLGIKSDIESYISIMDVCVLATFTEGISNAIMEYMALGKPVIATKGGGTNEIVQNEETGFLINPQNPTELSEKINLILNNNDLRKKLGNRGKQRIIESFSINNMVNSYLYIYKRLIKP